MIKSPFIIISILIFFLVFNKAFAITNSFKDLSDIEICKMATWQLKTDIDYRWMPKPGEKYNYNILKVVKEAFIRGLQCNVRKENPFFSKIPYYLKKEFSSLSNNDRMIVQRELKRRNYYKSIPDGQWSLETSNAVEDYGLDYIFQKTKSSYNLRFFRDVKLMYRGLIYSAKKQNNSDQIQSTNSPKGTILSKLLVTNSSAAAQSNNNRQLNDSSLIPSELKDRDVCYSATVYQGTKKRFRNSSYFLPFVAEAKRRGLNCGVAEPSVSAKTLDEDPAHLRSVISELKDEFLTEQKKVEELNTLLALSKSQFAELQDTLNELREDIYKPIGYNDNLFVALYFLLHLFIIFFFFSFLIIERSRSKLLIENDGLDFERTSHNTVISSGIGKIPYAIFRFIFRPLILLSLFALIGWSGYLMKWMVMLPALGIILLTISFNSPFLRILFPILILGGATDLLLRFI